MAFINVTDSAQGNSSVNPDSISLWDDIHPQPLVIINWRAKQPRCLVENRPLGEAGNISTGAWSGRRDVLSGGLLSLGQTRRKSWVRAIGPSLASFGISGVLTDPTVRFTTGNHAIVATNDNWKSNQQAQIEATGRARKMIWNLPRS